MCLSTASEWHGRAFNQKFTRSLQEIKFSISLFDISRVSGGFCYRASVHQIFVACCLKIKIRGYEIPHPLRVLKLFSGCQTRHHPSSRMIGFSSLIIAISIFSPCRKYPLHWKTVTTFSLHSVPLRILILWIILSKFLGASHTLGASDTFFF